MDEDLGVERLLYRAQNRFVFCDCRNEVIYDTSLQDTVLLIFKSEQLLCVRNAPVVEYFNAIRLEKAKELLVSTNMDIADIVSRIGYVDVSSFIRKFKARFGVTPGKFRELHQNKSCTCC